MYFESFIMGEKLNTRYIFSYFGDSRVKNVLKIILTVIFIIPHYAIFLVQAVLAFLGSIPLLGLPFLLVSVLITFLIADNITKLMFLPYLSEIKEDSKRIATLASYLMARDRSNYNGY